MFFFCLDSQSGRPLIIAFGSAYQIDCLPGMGMIETVFRDLTKADNNNRA